MQSGAQGRIELILAAILRSLSKILIKNNIPLVAITEVLKRSLVEAATEDGSATDSLVSLRTGVHRKDVKRLRAVIAEGTSENSPIRGLAVILSVWANDTRFRDSDGRPRVLHRNGTSDNPGFDDLVRASKVDLAPATVLQELETQALINKQEGGQVELLSTTFVAHTGEAALRAFEATITDHLRIAAQNVLSPPGAPRHFDQVVRYSHLSAGSVEALDAEARKQARAYLEHMNAMAHRLQSEDEASGQLASGKFVSGVYVAPVLPEPKPETEETVTSTKKDKTQ